MINHKKDIITIASIVTGFVGLWMMYVPLAFIALSILLAWIAYRINDTEEPAQ